MEQQTATATKTDSGAPVSAIPSGFAHKSNLAGTNRQMVCFRLGNEDFGIDMANVQVIDRIAETTKLSTAHSYVESSLEWLGNSIPVVDLRARFGLDQLAEKSSESRILVVESQSATLGLIVDAVTEVVQIADDKIQQSTADTQSALADQYIAGVAKPDKNKQFTLLATENLFTPEEVSTINNVMPSA